MKKTLFVILLIVVCQSIAAQSIISCFLERFGKDENLRVVSIGKQMLEKIAKDASCSFELKEAISGLDCIRIITSDSAVSGDEYFDSAYAIMLNDKSFQELYSENNEDKQLSVMVRESKKNVNELIILSGGSDGFSLIDLSGNIDLKELAGYASQLNFKELEKLNELKSK